MPLPPLSSLVVRPFRSVHRVVLGASGDTLLRIEIAEDVLAAFEWIEEGKPYREWLVPAAILNAGTVMLSAV